MIGKGVLLGFIIFIVDILLYGLYAATSLDEDEVKSLIEKLKFTIPIGLFMPEFCHFDPMTGPLILMIKRPAWCVFCRFAEKGT